MKSTVLSAVLYSVALVAAVGLISGCNDQASPLGSDFITDTLKTVVVSSDTTSLLDSAYNGRITVALTNGGDKSNTNVYLVGETQDVRSTAFLRFSTVPDSIAGLTASELVSASLKMYPLSYAYGDTQSNTLAFKVRHIAALWGPEATTDTLAKGGFYGDEVASYSGVIGLNDTLAVTIPLPNTERVHQWLFADSARYGLALVPESGARVVRQFSTIGVGDVERNSTGIELVYRRNGASQNDTIVIPSAYINTFVEALVPLPAERLTIQGGVVHRSHLFFDVSIIPPLATIHRAELVLVRDASASRIGAVDEEPKIIARFADDSSLTSADGSYALGTRRYGTDEYVFPNIAPAVERWLRGGTANYGMIIHMEAGYELRETNRLVFYGLNDPDPTRRPRLTVVYSIPAAN